MPELIRRRYPERPGCWHVHYGDVCVGTIAIRVGIPHDEERWGWDCGFYPGSEPGEQTSGTGATFDEARKGFEEAWRLFSAKRTEADYQAWRDQRDWMGRKYAMWERGERMQSQKPNSLMNKPTGDNARKGAVKKRTQLKNPLTKTSTKRNKKGGQFMAVKKSA